MFDKLRDNAELCPFNNEKYYGLSIHWAMKGMGFGELVFAVDKATGEVTVDKECMSDETCASIIDILRTSGKIVPEHGFIDAGNMMLPSTVVAPKEE